MKYSSYLFPIGGLLERSGAKSDQGDHAADGGAHANYSLGKVTAIEDGG